MHKRCIIRNMTHIVSSLSKFFLPTVLPYLCPPVFKTKMFALFNLRKFAIQKVFKLENNGGQKS